MAIFSYPETSLANTTSFELEVAKGNVPGHTAINIFGNNDAIGTTFIPVWENNTAYVYPSSATQMSLSSSSASDTSVSILVNGLDSDLNLLSEVVSLNGTTAVSTVGSYLRINNLITTVGNAVGDVSITNGGNTYAKITAGTGRSQAAIYTVPEDHDFYLYRLGAFSATATTNKYLTFRNFVNGQTETTYRVARTTFENTLSVTRVIPFKYGPRSDIQLQVRSSSGTNEVGAFAEGILISNV